MAALCISGFRLFKFTQTPRFLQKVVLNNPPIKISTLENIVLVQNIRLFAENGEYEPKHRFGTPLVQRKKTVPIQKIFLLSSEGKIIEKLSMDQAQQLAKRRNLNLVQVVDVNLKATLPTYQLMSKTQIAEEEQKAKNQKRLDKSTAMKPAKLLIMSSKIDKHDLETKINKINQLLKKKHKVQVYVSTDGNKLLSESVLASIETGVAENGKLKSKVAKGQGMKLYFDPIIPELVATKESKIDTTIESEPDEIKTSKPAESTEPKLDETKTETSS